MRKLLLALPVIALGLLAAPAEAQGPYARPPVNPGNPYARPIFSPWLNLAQNNGMGLGNIGGFNPGITYAGIIRPEMGYNSAINSLEQQNLSTAAALQQQNAFDQQLLTGHRSVFQNLSHYYPTSRYGGGNANPYTMRPAATVQGQRRGYIGGGMGGMGGIGQTGLGAGRAPQQRR